MTAQVTVQKSNIVHWDYAVNIWQTEAGLCTVKLIKETETEFLYEIDAVNGAILFYMGNSYGMDLMMKFSQGVRAKVETIK
jgi:hypothetical protein